MTRKKTPIVDDFTGDEIDDTDSQRYTVEFTQAISEKGQIIKSQRLDMSHASFKKFVLDKGIIPKWNTIQKNPATGKWETIKG